MASCITSEAAGWPGREFWQSMLTYHIISIGPNAVLCSLLDGNILEARGLDIVHVPSCLPIAQPFIASSFCKEGALKQVCKG